VRGKKRPLNAAVGSPASFTQCIVAFRQDVWRY